MDGDEMTREEFEKKEFQIMMIDDWIWCAKARVEMVIKDHLGKKEFVISPDQALKTRVMDALMMIEAGRVWTNTGGGKKDED